MFSKFFIERPIFAIVVSLIICLAGGIAMTQLPVVTVSKHESGTDYRFGPVSGRGCQDAGRFRRRAAGKPDQRDRQHAVHDVVSSSSGQLQLTVFFNIGTDPDIAQVQGTGTG